MNRMDYIVGEAFSNDLGQLYIDPIPFKGQLAIPGNVLNSHLYLEDFIPHVYSK